MRRIAFSTSAVVAVLLPLAALSQPADAPEPPPAPGGNASGARPALEGLSTRELVLDLSVPESPAFEVLGFTPERVSRPTSPRELAANLLNGVDERGNLQTGIAIDFSLYQLLHHGTEGNPKNEITLQEYRDDPITKLLTRSQLSVATTKGSSSDDKAVRLGAGLKMTLWDSGDIRVDRQFTGCLAPAHALVHQSLGDLLDPMGGEETLKFNERIRKSLPEEIRKEREQARQGQDAHDIDIAAIILLSREVERAKLRDTLNEAHGKETAARVLEFLDEEGKLQEAQKMTRDCFADAKRRNWNRPSWDIGGALSWSSADGQVSELGHAGGAVWSSISINYPGKTRWGFTYQQGVREEGGDSTSDFFREHFQFILHTRYRGQQEVPDTSATATEGSTITQDLALVGGRLRAGWPEFALSAEGAYTYTKPRREDGDGAAFYSVGAEYRIAEDLWLQLSVGSEAEKRGGNEDASILGSIKYGFSSTSPFELFEAVRGARPAPAAPPPPSGG